MKDGVTERAAGLLGTEQWTAGEALAVADALGADAEGLFRLVARSAHLPRPVVDRLAERVG